MTISYLCCRDYQKRSVVHIPKVEVSIVGHGVGLPVVQGLQGGQQHPEQIITVNKKWLGLPSRGLSPKHKELVFWLFLLSYMTSGPFS